MASYYKRANERANCLKQSIAKKLRKCKQQHSAMSVKNRNKMVN